MSRNWRLVEAVERNNLYQVYEQLRDGANVELHYVGVTPLQMAVESYNPDTAALLLHWKADPDAHTASRAAGSMYASGETSRELCERLLKKTPNPTKLKNLTHIKKMMEDKVALQKHVDELQVKIIELEKQYSKARMTSQFRWMMVGVFLCTTVVVIHFIMVLAPEFAVQTFAQKFLNDVYTYSPFFLKQNPFAPPKKLRPGDYKYCRVLEDSKTIVPLSKAGPHFYKHKDPNKVSWLSGKAASKNDDEEL
mmetsp:Transcript_30206/g.59014  ORF Transcript_30206/g.59014 Transcript_30206/m.59014 type:complete len:251 (-) Transcript_30206:205-957(-)|eukprot:CAMPEP_0173385914 /NCGR_PEP_ID=MMETSP1356-20130122/8515_1 /TAXON_ID=77927 ORGANISM="Hemiselmis virescens, Strain PCC157" /NCGR_SAMPLE_ID=MMETSP1356 /ASSEMBLY_ACC=CAM_ASM_000847 /LENGTH=250 /DNA_ID=CAMNT_0014341935 /DNA_START=195 /DNA_END=947 /DNA_ORIENTATION=-